MKLIAVVLLSQVMSKDLFDYLVREKIADGPLIAKWRKPGYEILCSMLAIQKVRMSGQISRAQTHAPLLAPPQRISALLASHEPCAASVQGNHNFGTTSHCRVPLKSRAGQLRITPDVQIGCISCASTDGRFGGPVWCASLQKFHAVVRRDLLRPSTPMQGLQAGWHCCQTPVSPGQHSYQWYRKGAC